MQFTKLWRNVIKTAVTSTLPLAWKYRRDLALTGVRAVVNLALQGYNLAYRFGRRLIDEVRMRLAVVSYTVARTSDSVGTGVGIVDVDGDSTDNMDWESLRAGSRPLTRREVARLQRKYLGQFGDPDEEPN